MSPRDACCSVASHRAGWRNREGGNSHGYAPSLPHQGPRSVDLVAAHGANPRAAQLPGRAGTARAHPRPDSYSRWRWRVGQRRLAVRYDQSRTGDREQGRMFHSALIPERAAAHRELAAAGHSDRAVRAAERTHEVECRSGAVCAEMANSAIGGLEFAKSSFVAQVSLVSYATPRARVARSRPG